MNDITHTAPRAALDPAHSPVVVILILDLTHEIRADLFQLFISRLREIDQGRDYGVEEICGRDYWRSLPKIDRIRGGKTIAYLVKTGQLPLAFTTCPHAVPKRYRLK